MMGHRQDDQAALFYEFSLERHVPDDHLLRSIDRFVELGGVRRESATWQLSCLPSWPQYCRATPTECRPYLGKPVSSMIQASIGP